jgi:hypothetical protein
MCENCKDRRLNHYQTSISKEIRETLEPHFKAIKEDYDRILYHLGDLINRHPEMNEYDIKEMIAGNWELMLASGIEIGMRAVAYAHTKCKNDAKRSYEEWSETK